MYSACNFNHTKYLMHGIQWLPDSPLSERLSPSKFLPLFNLSAALVSYFNQQISSHCYSISDVIFIQLFFFFLPKILTFNKTTNICAFELYFGFKRRLPWNVTLQKEWYIVKLLYCINRWSADFCPSAFPRRNQQDDVTCDSLYLASELQVSFLVCIFTTCALTSCYTYKVQPFNDFGGFVAFL